MSRSGTRRRRDALCAFNCFATQNLEIGGIHSRQFEINHGPPCGVRRMEGRDIILAECLINYYAK